MLFHTVDYLFLFLPITVAAYWLTPRRLRLWVLFLASVVFYASWSIFHFGVLALAALVAWGGARWITAHQEGGSRGELGRRTLILGLLILPLFLFKYWDWLAGDAEHLLGLVGVEITLPKVHLPLPVGISFFTFQAMAYVIDSARSREAEPSPLTFATFLSWFPQLVAGPIVRKRELMPQLLNLPMLREGRIGQGIWRISKGIAKKVLIADVVRVGMVDPIFADPGRFTGPELLIALYAYTLQIYCDFSAYTDIALGSAHLFGIDLPENFRRPYKALCVAGFWRRWHLTLSNWVRDYVYYPLGGSQVEGGQWKVYRNILATMVIIGIWHGASWNFVIYGLLHGTAVGICRLRRKQTGRRPDDPLDHWWQVAWRWVGTFHFVVLARILFRAPDLPHAADVFLGLGRPEWVLPRFSPTVWAVFFLGFALHFTPSAWPYQLEEWFKRQSPPVWALAAGALAIACVWLGNGDALAFVYYQF